MKKRKVSFSIFAISALLLSVFGVFVAVSAQDKAGEIKISKTATKYISDDDATNEENLIYGNKAKVDLTVKGVDYDRQNKLDIVLIIDKSGSMNNKINNSTKLSIAQNTAKDFINGIMTDDNDVMFGVVEFSSSGYLKNYYDQRGDKTATNKFSMTSNKTTALGYIDNDIDAEGGTNYYTALIEAKKLLEESKNMKNSDGTSRDAKQVLIFLTDGIPTFFTYNNKELGTGNNDDAACLNNATSGNTKYYKDDSGNVYYFNNRGNKTTTKNYSCPSGFKKPSDAAKEIVELNNDSIKKSYPELDIYSVMFGSSDFSILNKVNTPSVSQDSPIYQNIAAEDADQLEEYFKTILANLKAIGTQAKVTDTIPEGFELTSESLDKINNDPNVSYDSKTRTITWNVGSIEDKEYKYTYELQTIDGHYGSMYTNTEAKLDVVVQKDNPVYGSQVPEGKTEGSIQLTFDKPSVEMPTVTKDDHYNDIPSYNGYEGENINGTTILNNDYKLQSDSTIKQYEEISKSETGTDRTTTVTDEIVVTENDTTIKNSDGSYTIKDDKGNELGTLYMNSQDSGDSSFGTFEFVPNEGVTGEVSFDYRIKTNVETYNETDYVLSNESTVTLNISPREKTSLVFTKVWKDENNKYNKRPDSIVATVTGKVGQKTIYEKDYTLSTKNALSSDKNTWKITVDGLYVYEKGYEKDSNHKIKYTITEKSVINGYTSTVDGNKITNTMKDMNEILNPIDLTIKKVDSKTSTGVTITGAVFKVFSDESCKEEAKNVTVTENSGVHSVEFTKDGTYYIKEVSAPTGYEVNDTVYRITVVKGNVVKVEYNENTKVFDKYIDLQFAPNDYSEFINGVLTVKDDPELTDVSITKVWEDSSDQDGLRKDITFGLYDGSNKVDEKTLTKDSSKNAFTITFKDLIKYRDGEEIKYTVKEETSLTGYTTTPTNKTVENNGTITNKHVPELTTFDVTKVWDDNNNQDGIRPDSVTITINGTVDGKVIDKLTKAETINKQDGNSWTYTFNDLDKFYNGKEVTYVLASENKINNYEISNQTNNSITNKHVPETVDVPVTKEWKDSSDRDGFRPSSIIITLTATNSKTGEVIDKLCDSKAISIKDETEDTNIWKTEFKDLPKYNNGVEITYTVDEELTDEVSKKYTKSFGEDENYIINTHNSVDTQIKVTKTWEDNSNQDGIRPDSIELKLTALVDGEEDSTLSKTVTLKKQDGNNWIYTFDHLQKFKNGKEVIYQVTEETKLENYTVTYTDGKKYAVNNGVITNTHDPEKTTYTVKKIWDDYEDVTKDKTRDSYGVTLYKTVDGVTEAVGDEVILDRDTLEYTWKNLDVYENGNEITYSVDETKLPKGYIKSVNGNIITNTIDEIEKLRPIDLTINKVDSKTTTGVILPGSKFTVYSDEECTKASTNVVIKTENDIHTVTFNVDGTYFIKETTPPTGYKLNEGTFKITVVRGTVVEVEFSSEDNKFNKWISLEFGDCDSSFANGILTVKDDPELTNISIKKEWEDNNDQDGLRKDIKFGLYDGSNKVDEKTLSKDSSKNSFTITFENLPKYRDGEEIEYTVKEETSLNGYTTTPSNKTVSNNGTITNKHTPEVTTFDITKVWKDENNQDGKRPKSITVTINGLVDGNVVEALTKTETIKLDDVKVSEDGNTWTYTFNNLDKYYNSGKLVKYVIAGEVEIKDYEGSIDQSKDMITNTHIPETVSVPVVKEWIDSYKGIDDFDGLRPDSIKINLTAKNSKTGEIIDNLCDSMILSVSDADLEKSNIWKSSFDNLPKYNNGVEITYTIDEDLDGDVSKYYDKTIDPNNDKHIINSHSPRDIKVIVNKIWDDENNKYGRPDKVTVNLKASVGEEELSFDTLGYTGATTKDITGDNWTTSFEGLPEYYKGKLINYTITEDSVLDYVITSIKSDESVATEKVFDITNTYNPELTSISGTKTWEDNDDQDGIRPESITLNLYSDHDEDVIKTIDVVPAADGSWRFEFKDLIKYANGTLINYTIKEETVDGYETTISDEDFTVTNSHTPITTSYKVSKEWDDFDNNDGIRPDAITIRLIAQDKETGSVIDDSRSVELSDSNSWTYTFSDLPVYYNHGREIQYIVMEDEVAGYTTNILDSIVDIDNNVTFVTIKNSHELIMKDIKIVKKWDDLDNIDNTRPTSITVYVYADGVLIDTITITKESDWMKVLSLQVFNQGKEITYTVKEDSVDKYSTSYKTLDDTFTITNTYRPGKGEIVPPNTGITITNSNDSNVNLIELILALISFVTIVFTKELKSLKN